MLRFSQWFALCAALCVSTVLRADVIGDTLSFEIDAGQPPDTFGLGQTVQAPGSVTFGALALAVSASQVTLTATRGGFAVDEGFYFEVDDVTKDPRITGISLDPASTLGYVTSSLYMANCYFFDPCPYVPPGYNSVLLVVEGQRPWQAGQQAIFDLTFGPETDVAPEPGSLVLLGTGVVGLVARLRRYGRR